MMNWYGDGGYGWMGGGAMLFMALFWILIVGVGIWLITHAMNRDKSRHVQDSPKQILDRRLASGEIDAEAYKKSRGLIEGKSMGTGEES